MGRKNKKEQDKASKPLQKTKNKISDWFLGFISNKGYYLLMAITISLLIIIFIVLYFTKSL